MPIREEVEFPITLEIEEELYLVDHQSSDILLDPSSEIFEECKQISGPHKVICEFMRSQIESDYLENEKHEWHIRVPYE